MSERLGAPRRRRRLVAVLLVTAAAAVAQAGAGDEPSTRALLVVKTLVIDALGTRTVDTDTARIPFGKTGLLIKQVPYGGPAVSFKLSVRADAPQPTGIPLVLSADVWPGEASPPPLPDRVSHREEATVLAEGSSYLLELIHDEVASRRILLSFTARAVGDKEAMGPLPVARPVHFFIEVTRQAEGRADEMDSHALTTLLGRPVTFSSAVRPLAGRTASGEAEAQDIGLTISVLPQSAEGDLLTVSVDLTGAEYVDDARSRIEPIAHHDVHTVRSGTRFLVTVTVPPDAEGDSDAGEEGLRPVTYVVFITPTMS